MPFLQKIILHFMIDSGEQAHKKQSRPTGQADQHIHLVKKILLDPQQQTRESSFSVP